MIDVHSRMGAVTWGAGALLVALSSLGCHDQKIEARPLTVVKVEAIQSRAEDAQAVRYSGSVIPETQIQIAFKVGGYVQEILRVRGADGRLRLAQEGDRVQRGAVLAQVRQIDYTTTLAQARSQWDGAQAQAAQARSRLAEVVASKDQAESGLTQAKTAKRSAETQLADTRAGLALAQAQLLQVQASRKQAEAQLVSAEASREQATLDFERAAKLYDTQSLTKSDFDAARARRDSTQAQAEAVRQQIQAVGAQEEASRAQIASTQAKVEGAKAQIETSESRIRQARGQLAQSQAMVSTAREQITASLASARASRAQFTQAGVSLGDATLKAPMDGVLLSRSIEVGSLVGPNSVGFVLADTRRVKVAFGVPDLEVARLKLGDPVAFSVEAIPGAAFSGRITSISPAADEKSRVFNVEVSVPNSGSRLKVGMIASLTLGLPSRQPVRPLVPMSAIVRSPGKPKGFAVFVVKEEGGRHVARTHEITIGTANGNLISTSAGVKAGDRVIVRGATIVKDGEPVQILQ